MRLIKKWFFIYAAMFLFITCQDNSKSKKPQNIEPTIVNQKSVNSDKILKLDFNLSTNVKDKFQCVFVNIDLENNKDGLYIISKEINASQNFKQVSFKMSGDYIPGITQVRLGNNAKEVRIEKVLISYSDRKIEIFGDDVSRYFYLSNQVKFDTISKKLIVKPDNKGIPSITVRESFIKRVFDL